MPLVKKEHLSLSRILLKKECMLHSTVKILAPVVHVNIEKRNIQTESEKQNLNGHGKTLNMRKL